MTLHSLDGENDEASPLDENAPLLRSRSNSNIKRRRGDSPSLFQQVKDYGQLGWQTMFSDTGTAILKCSFAYLLGSLAVFVPSVSSLLGTQDGKHMVATVTVYFHPARSLGSMLEAIFWAEIAFLYAAFISVTSMTVSVIFTDWYGLPILGHIIVLILFVGLGLGFIGWFKQWMGNDLVNVACSLTSLAIITVLTKEGAVQRGDFSFIKIVQVLKMVQMGIVATGLVSVCIRFTWAQKSLNQRIVDVTDALSGMLGSITNSFISGNENELTEQPYKDLEHKHGTAFGTLNQQLREAKHEHFLLGTERQFYIEVRMIRCIQRITQTIGGLRTACSMQFSVVRQPQSTHRLNTLRSISAISTPMTEFDTLSRVGSVDYAAMQMPPIDEADNEDDDNAASAPTPRTPGEQSLVPLRTPSEIFDVFLDNFGPHMHSLAYTVKQILDELPYGSGTASGLNVNPKLRSSLGAAIDLYSQRRKEAVRLVYEHKDISKASPLEVEADWEEAAACCGQFSFSLLDVASQVKEYLLIVDELHLEVEERPSGRTWHWTWKWILAVFKRILAATSQLFPKIGRRSPDFASDLSQDEAPDTGIAAVKSKEDTKGQDGSPSSGLSRAQVFSRWVYDKFHFLRRDDIKYAIKVGAGAIVYASFSFIPETRETYQHWRGEWGLLSYMLVCSMTIGASNTTGYQRFLGTFAGAVVANIAWFSSNDNVFVLAFFGWLMSCICFYIIIGKKKGPMGRFIMLTYNLSALYAWSLSVKDDENDDDEGGRTPDIFEISGHRVVAVLAGCFWGMFITRAIWPLSARTRLPKDLSNLWLGMGLIWKRDPLSMFLVDDRPNEYMNISEEVYLQKNLATLEKMASSASGEFELKGPFHDKAYSKMLKATGRMLDAFHSMNVVVLKSLVASPGELALLKATIRERQQLCSRISHLFSGKQPPTDQPLPPQFMC